MMNKSYLLLCAVLMSHDNGSTLRRFLPHMVQEHLFLPLNMHVLHYEAVHLAASAAAVIGGVASR